MFVGDPGRRAIVVFVVALFGAVSPAQFVPPFPLGGGGVLAGAALVFFAYIGFDTVTVASEEAREPVRDVPRAVIWSLIDRHRVYMVASPTSRSGIVPWKTVDPNAGDGRRGAHAGNARWLQRGRVRGRVRRHDDGDAHLAAGPDADLLRDGARPHAAADRRADRPRAPARR